VSGGAGVLWVGRSVVWRNDVLYEVLFFWVGGGGGGGGMLAHVCISHVQVRTGEQDLNITCEHAAQLSQNFV